MEIKGAWLAELCGTKRQNVYMLTRSGKLEKSVSGLYNISDPLNAEFLRSHSKSRIDAENFMKEKESVSHCRTTPPKKENDQSMQLLQSVELVITREYSTDESTKIKSMIFEEMKKIV